MDGERKEDLSLYVVLKVHEESKGAVDCKGLQFFYLPLWKNVVIC